MGNRKRRWCQLYHARRKASARSSTFPDNEPKRRGANAVARSIAASLFNLCVPLCVENTFLMVAACTSTCFLYDRHCRTVCTICRHEDNFTLESTNWRSMTTRSAASNAALMRSQNAVMHSKASHVTTGLPQKMSALFMSFTTPFSVRHHARLRKPGSMASTIICHLYR